MRPLTEAQRLHAARAGGAMLDKHVARMRRAGSAEADIQRFIAAYAEAFAQSYMRAYTGALTEGCNLERARLQAILRSDEAAGREGLAHSLAFESDVDPSTAAAILARTPRAMAAGALRENPFVAAMSALKNPDVGTDGYLEEDDGAAAVRRILEVRASLGRRDQ